MTSLFLASLGFQGDVGDFPKLLEVIPIHDRLVCLHIDEGYVLHHGLGQKRSDEKVIAVPLDTAVAASRAAYSLSMPQDPAWKTPLPPTKVGRKSKGTEFAWFVDEWVNGRTINKRLDHAKEHWLYLELPRAMTPGGTLQIAMKGLGPTLNVKSFGFNPASSRSESVHVNLLGWTPDSPVKRGYLYHWAGDLGPVDFKAYEGKTFHLRDADSGASVFQGKVAFRAGADTQETFHTSDSPPHGSFLKAPVWEMDFSSFSKPGRYVLSVDSLGCSFPFEIKEDVYRPVFQATARALYHNRSGIELKKPYTDFTRPAPHNPKLTPGFAGKLQYTSVRMQEWGSEGGDAKALQAGFKGPIETAGWYQDAGDWDSYHTHLRVATELLFAYQIASENFKDGELNIPESGNTLPDILDEAAWLPRFCQKLRKELLTKKYGTGGLGLRIAGDAFGGDGEGKGSWQDVERFWAVSGEDPLSTYRYAGAAAHLAVALKEAKLADPEKVDWVKEAKESYAWAQKNTKPGDENELRPHRAYAAAALFRATGDKAYERQLASDTASFQGASQVYGDDAYALMIYCLPGEGSPDSALMARLRGALLTTAEEVGIKVPARRALRWGGNFSFPMLIGQQTTPWVLEAAVGWFLIKGSDPAKAKLIREGLVGTGDYFLGTNPLNMTWVTGIGPRNPTAIFHMDAWYNGKGKFHPGLIPYSPWRKQQDFGEGPWSQFWPYKTVYPAKVEDWPGAEQWFSNRCSPMGSEFTVHQNIGPAAAFYGIMCSKAR